MPTVALDEMRMDHVSLTVLDVDRSIEFYKAAGLKLLRISVLTRDDQVYRNAYLYNGRFMLELLPARKGTHERQRRVSRGSDSNLPGSTHLGVRVRDLDAAIKRLGAAGAKMISEPRDIPKNAVEVVYFDKRADRAIHYVHKPRSKPWRIAMFVDPDGFVVELVER